jgi:diadenosine tetraphosphate (Ap4A) HIT family hydrolase
VTQQECLLCETDRADVFFDRVRVWQDEHWRLSVVRKGKVAGFSHLESRRHIPYLTELDGPESATLGPALARVTSALKAATGAELVYVYVFGERVAHLHFNLAPHHPGDALVGGPGLVHADAAEVGRAVHESVAAAVVEALGR